MENRVFIDFIKCEYGGAYGGGLDEPFRYMGRIISDRFQSENIEFSCKEIEIQLTFLKPNEKSETDINFYSKLPNYYRGKNMIRVSVPFSTEQEKDLSSLFQLIYKVFDIIASKKKKGDVYDKEKIESSLLKLEEELKSADLWELNQKYENLLRQKTIERVKKERETREQANNEGKRLIYDLRLYYRFDNIGNLYFAPYDNRLCDRILEKLRQRKFKLPGYSHLYVQVSDTFENALYHSVRAENWFVYGLAVLENYIDYETKSEAEKQKIIFGLIKEGLHDIAKIDKLDVNVLNEVLDEVEKRIK